MSENVARVIGELLPMLIRWIQSAISKGRNPVADLQAAMDAADVIADAAESAKFGVAP